MQSQLHHWKESSVIFVAARLNARTHRRNQHEKSRTRQESVPLRITLPIFRLKPDLVREMIHLGAEHVTFSYKK